MSRTQNETASETENSYRRVHSVYPEEEIQDDLIDAFDSLLSEAEVGHVYVRLDDLAERDELSSDRLTDSSRRIGRNMQRAANQTDVEVENWSKYYWLIKPQPEAEEGEL